MKTRHSLVSNSSTTSFCIYGTEVERRVVEEDPQRYKAEELEDHYGNPNYGDENIFIGISWCNIKDNETGAEFKKRVKDALEKWLGKEVECSTIERAYNDC